MLTHPSRDQSCCSLDTGDVLIRAGRIRLSDRRPDAEPGVPSVRITVQKLPDLQQRGVGAEPQPDSAAPPRTAVERQPGMNHGHDLLTSRFTPGARGAVLAALRQHAPQRRDITEHLEQQGPSASSQSTVGTQTWGERTSCHRVDTATAAAIAAVSAAAPLIRNQSNMESRVSQLADGVQRLLQDDGGRSLNQHLESLLSHQLQLQSQLLESAVNMVTGATPRATSDSSVTCGSGCLKVTHLDTEAANGQKTPLLTSTAIRDTTVESELVSMVTPSPEKRPEQTRDNGHHSVATAAVNPLGSANERQAARTRANNLVRDGERLKADMKMLLKQPDDVQASTIPEEPLPTEPGPPRKPSAGPQSRSRQYQVHTRKHQIQSRLNQVQARQGLIQSNKSQIRSQTHLDQTHLQRDRIQSLQDQIKTQQNQIQFIQDQIQSSKNQNQPKKIQCQTYVNESEPPKKQSMSQPDQPRQNQNPQTEQNPAHRDLNPESQHDPAHQEPIQFWDRKAPAQFPRPLPTQLQQSRPRPIPAVQSALEEAAQVLHQVRQQKRVLEENMESLLRAKSGDLLHWQLEALAANRDGTQQARVRRTVDAWISTLTRDIQAEMSTEEAAEHFSSTAAAVQKGVRSRSSTHAGKRVPVGTPRGKGSKMTGGQSRGRVAENNVEAEPDQGGEQADAELYLTQLYGRAPHDGLRRTLKKSPYLRLSSQMSPPGRRPRPRVVESVRGVKVKSCKTQTSLASLLSSSHGRPPPPPCNTSPLPPTQGMCHSVPMAIPLGRPRLDPSPGRQQEVTTLPVASPICVSAQEDQEPGPSSGELDAGGALPPPCITVDKEERRSEEEEDEEVVFPGTDFLSVADVIQEEASVLVEEEEEEEAAAAAMEVDGSPSPPPVLYQGPAFPPQTGQALPPQNPDVHQRGDSLENRLVEWVEQQLMARMISDMYCPPPPDPVQNHSMDQSELEEQSVTSDIVEAGGGGGLQLFVDANMPVDSALIRQLVQEVLAETISHVLGERDTLDPGLELEPQGLEMVERSAKEDPPLVPTPVPTPSASPAPPHRQTGLIPTPPPSKPTSPVNQDPEPITAPEPLATPTPSPEPAPAAESPPAVNQAPPPLSWGDAELPLAEERPEEEPLDTRSEALIMSVAEVEPPASSPPPVPSSPPLESKPASPCSSSENSSDSSNSSNCSNISSSSLTTTVRPISEGELLISQQPEDGVPCSLSTSLQELHDMDLDVSSDLEVDRHKLLLNKMEGGVKEQGERPQPEGAWGKHDEDEDLSVGEMRDVWTTKPHMTTKPRGALNSAGAPRGERSPGQISQAADCVDAISQVLVATGNLMEEAGGTLTSDLHSNLSLSLPPSHLEDTHNGEESSSRRLEEEEGSIEVELTGEVMSPPASNSSSSF